MTPQTIRDLRCRCRKLLARHFRGQIEIKCPSCNVIHTIDTEAGTHLTESAPRRIMKQPVARISG